MMRIQLGNVTPTYVERLLRVVRSRKRIILWWCLIVWSLFGFSEPPHDSSSTMVVPLTRVVAQDPPQAANIHAQRLVIPLPITDEVDQQVMRAVDAVLDRFEKAGALKGNAPRPILVLEFRPREGTAGESSDFGRSYTVADFLASNKLEKVRTVAYLPQTVKGHSLLPVLGCQQIIMAEDAELGAAGISQERVAPEIRTVYEQFARRRWPQYPALVLGMLDRQLTVFQVETPQGPNYVLSDELEELKKQGLATESKQIIRAGDFGLFTGKQLRLEFGLVSHLVANETELAEALQIPPALLQQDPSLGQSRRAVRINLEGRVSMQKVTRLKRKIHDQIENHDINFLVLWIDSPGGSLAASVDLANYLAELDSTQVKTVAFINRQAFGDAAIPAMACDEIVMMEAARLGGPGDFQPSRKTLKNLEKTLQPIAQAKGRNWSLMKAMVDPQLEVFSYQHADTGDIRYLCPQEREQLGDGQRWTKQRALPVSEGLSATKAKEVGLNRKTVQSLEDLTALYQLGEELEVAETPGLTRFLDRLVGQPWFASTLLFFAFFALMAEASAPGLGIPGFVSAVCFMLFFWAQFLNGTAGWLEVLMFVCGIVFVALEVFVIPGLGVFGIGGGIMVVAALIMASQTFIIPRNSYQLEVFLNSVLGFIMASGGVLITVWAIYRFFPNNWWFRQVVLTPLSPEELAAQEHREQVVSWDYLVGETGLTSTPLVPAGKVRFGHKVIDVVSDGEMIEKGTAVRVVKVSGNRVVVKPDKPS